jgi:hypothetical protein
MSQHLEKFTKKLINKDNNKDNNTDNGNIFTKEKFKLDDRKHDGMIMTGVNHDIKISTDFRICLSLI